ncbi:MAG: glycosyltransferase family 4 protein [Actinomycetota bacterium]|nr:glycosyltransferase family 4 protein [Actinomycetota bacterium]MDK1016838.1 glycosyltransferase family 4 protein [Actinomycetota bacterium]MDK1026567.1 glycosyltransferase family 4 protein [Actinomycetota bacterium]MDK1039217.1 glycosyltransferase family 4 protein [Actinomycetota bacterium]MDK1097405.1 glycosyltransferase family 4 protein [Actinomycetota bacterium]
MRLLIVTNDYPPKPGGIQMYLKNLVAAYPDEVHVVAPADSATDLDESGVTRGHATYMLPTAKTRATILEAAEQFEPDAILFGAPHPLAFLGDRLRDRIGAPTGVLSHGAEVTILGAVPGLRQVLGRVLASADVRFAVSRFTARKVQRISGRPVEFLGAGVEIETFTPPDAAPNNPVPVVGCVSRFVPRKGQDRLLEAVAKLDRDVEVLFVGRGRTEAALRKKAASLGVEARFEIDVPWEELAGLYRRMDVFCMPCKSRWGGLEVEGLGLVFLEAAATGLPVLAGDSGGSPETVLPGASGFVVSDVDAIVEGLDIMLSDVATSREMGERGREFVVNEYTWGRVVERLYAGFDPYLV